MRLQSKTGLAFFLGILLPVLSFTDDNTAPKKYPYQSYLGCREADVSFLPKTSFDSLIALPLCAKDSHRNAANVQSFDIIYAERGLYQDSAGLPIIYTDYSTFKCDGASIPKNVVEMFKEHSYKGDTVFFENVKVLGPDQKSHPCKGMKVIIK